VFYGYIKLLYNMNSCVLWLYQVIINMNSCVFRVSSHTYIVYIIYYFFIKFLSTYV